MGREIKYIFNLKDNNRLEFDLKFNEDHDYIPSESDIPGDWAKLENHKCKNCPLDQEEHQYCPVAKNIDAIVLKTKDKLSYEKASIRVETPERVYLKDADTQEGLLSVFGLIMPTSGCPHLSWFKPLAKFHLPFSTIDETLFRVLSMQLVASFLNEEKQDGQIDLLKIQEKYTQIEIVNLDFIDRIRSHCRGDADVNAVAALDVFAKLFEFEKASNFEGIRKYFK